MNERNSKQEETEKSTEAGERIVWGTVSQSAEPRPMVTWEGLSGVKVTGTRALLL